ncbi:lytic transglycosylase domain-containing protein [Minwuia sp.]|uniref:lytic transglycosylase domain-containing protein n=1 Tax=Minwuia sp. TaxID=2493630 RepID=UPI003A92CD2D
MAHLTRLSLTSLAVAAVVQIGLLTVAAAATPPPPEPNPARETTPQTGQLSENDRLLYRQAFALANRGLFSAAQLTTAAVADPTLRPVLEWLRLRSRETMAARSDYDRFLADHADFPGLSTIERRREESVLENADAATLKSYFDTHSPVTDNGKVRLALLQKADGDTKAAVELAREVWRENNPDVELEEALLDAFAGSFTSADHWHRLDRLLWDGERSAAQRMYPLVPADMRALSDARLKLRYQTGDADQAYRAVPAQLTSDSGLTYERIQWLRRTDRSDEAQAMLLASGVLDGDLGKIWIERRVQIRNLIKERQFDKAYLIARDHGLSSGAAFAQGEFEAGWLALRFLGKPREALTHFQTLYDNVSYPVSRSRGAYWIGRAYAALGDTATAANWFRQAAGYQTTYYSQLGAHEIGERVINLEAAAVASPAEVAAFRIEQLPAIVRLLREVGQERLSRLFFAHMIKTSERPDIHPLALALAEEIDRPGHSVMAGKLADVSGSPAPRIAYPVAEAPDGQGHIASALAHAITRQESAFNQYAVSRAGARGLMQLMPATARQVARAEEVAYSLNRLTRDPAYNTRLGGAYLADQIDRFAGYLPMAAAAYNAGPHRVDRWLVEYGDPRVGQMDPVDWIEMIPFSETRNYTQRVMEALQVYRLRLAGVSRGETHLARDIGLRGTYLCGSKSGKPC